MTVDQIISMTAIVASAAVAIYSLHQSRKLQESLRQSELERELLLQTRQLENVVLTKSLETLQMSFHYLRRLQTVVAVGPAKDEEARQRLYEEIREATTYWETNYCYLPAFIRNKFVGVSNLVSLNLNPELRKQGIDMKTGEKISDLFDEIKASIERYVDGLNPLSQK